MACIIFSLLPFHLWKKDRKKGKLYPNPNNGEFNLAYDLKTNNEATLQITDVNGNTL